MVADAMVVSLGVLCASFSQSMVGAGIGVASTQPCATKSGVAAELFSWIFSHEKAFEEHRRDPIFGKGREDLRKTGAVAIFFS
jgi:hypothetical protein